MILFLLLALLPGSASAAYLVLTPCSKVTCEAPATKELGRDLAVSSVFGVTPSHECPQACSVVFTETQKLHVMGEWKDLVCRTWGGQSCGWRHDVVPDKEVDEMLERMNHPRKQ